MELFCSRAANSAVRGPTGSKFEFILDFLVVHLSCKNEEESIKNRGDRVLTIFSTL